MKKTAGLTLLELLIVIVVVSILAGFAAVRQRGLTDRARLAAATADARAVREAEAAFHADSGRFADLATLTRAGYAPQPSPGNQVTVTLDAQGYTATVEIEGDRNGPPRGGCRLEAGGSRDALACSSQGVPPSSSSQLPGGPAIAP